MKVKERFVNQVKFQTFWAINKAVFKNNLQLYKITMFLVILHTPKVLTMIIVTGNFRNF
jgi:hypothetical protein